MDNATGDGTQQEKAASSSQRLSLEVTAEPNSLSPRPENLRCDVQKREVAEHYTRDASLELCCRKRLCREGKASGLQQRYFKRGREKERRKERVCITKDITRKDKWEKPKFSLNHAGSATISQTRRATWENSISRGTAEHPDHSPGILREKPVPAQLRCLCHTQTIIKMLLRQHVRHRQQTAASISRMG